MGAGSATPIKSGMWPKSLSRPGSALGWESEDGPRVVAAELWNALPEDTGIHDERGEWERNFRGRCVEKLEKLGKAAGDSRGMMGLSDPTRACCPLIQRTPTIFSLSAANAVIELDALSHRGYEGKHIALHGLARHGPAFEALRMMFSKPEQSPDPQIRGCLHDKTQQAPAFEDLPIYDGLRPSMTTRLDPARIRREVKKFYRYVMSSHRWQPNEPTFQEIGKTSIYKLPVSPAFSKLQTFCKPVRTLRSEWAWSDTGCHVQVVLRLFLHYYPPS
ncbi:hypothetical protein HD554DRAFT_2174161 [Boletus coccyginus]|nr:hypothetical protein HD554DRAFT_2174161 [Boletus coccyginus]